MFEINQLGVYYTVADVARLKGKSKAMVLRHIAEGRVKAITTDLGIIVHQVDFSDYRANKPGRPKRAEPQYP